MRLNPIHRTGLLLVIAGLTISLTTSFWSRAMNDVPLSIPIVLSPGQFQSPEFETRESISYLINITFDSGIASEELDCLIGMNLKDVQPCTNRPGILNVKWRLLSRSRPVVTGSSTELRGASYSYHKVQRHIGNFAAQSGQVYTVQLDILQDATRLGEAHPILEIEPDLNGYEGWLLLSGLAFYMGLLGAVIGIIVILVAVFRGKQFGPIPSSD
jgi:hypothetical protein